VAEGVLNCGCGVLVPPLIRRLCEDNISLCEEISGIPGTVGGLVYSNAGAFGKEISDIFISARIYLPFDNKIVLINKSEMNFSYRDSYLKHNDAILLDASFKVNSLARVLIFKRISEFSSLRRENQPTDKLSLGSTFLKHNGISIAKLIDELSLKGYSVGGAMISHKHAGFIINNGAASSMDYLQLVSIIQSKINNHYFFVPHLEIEVLK
jgi:UDP-N-acetylmuramate dehydrogenase